MDRSPLHGKILTVAYMTHDSYGRNIAVTFEGYRVPVTMFDAAYLTRGVKFEALDGGLAFFYRVRLVG